MKKLLSIVLALSMLVSLGAFAFAEEAQPEESAAPTEPAGEQLPYTSEEVLYGVLDSDGTTDSIYSVVIVDSAEAGKAEYYGPFADVKNLTDTREIGLDKGCVSFDAPEGRFYFQSTLDDDSLPWDISIKYTLDGKNVKAEELGGKSGELGINITVKDGGMDDSSFYDSYLMQVSVTLDSRLCTNIKADGATLANSGANKLINFSVMPGTDTELSLTADVVNFSMPGITLSGVPFSMGDSLGDVDELTDGLTTLTDAISQLSSGANQLSGGASKLLYGAYQFGDGLYQLSASSPQLVEASATFLAAFNAIRDQIQNAVNSPGDNITDIDSLVAALDGVCTQLESTAASLGENANNLDSVCNTMDGTLSGVPDSTVTDVGVVSGVVSGLSDEAKTELAACGNSLSNVLTAASCAAAAKAQWFSVSQSLRDTATRMHSLALQLEALTASIRNFIGVLNGMSGTEGGDRLNEILASVNQLADGYSQFHDGLVQYTGGVDALADNWGQLYDGIYQLTGGTYQLSDGTSQLNEGTKEIPDKVDSMLSSFTGGDFEAHSFLSDKNTGTDSVQFVLTTQAVTLPADVQQADIAKNDESTLGQFWDRLKDLFV